MKLAKKDAPQQALTLMAAAGSFAAVSSLFGSPVVGAVIIIEAAGLGGAMLPLVLLPGLLAAGIGSLVFIGIGSWTGLPTSNYALKPLSLPAYSEISFADFGWTILLAVIVAVVTFAIIQAARLGMHVVSKRPFVLTIVAALVVGGLAIAFNQATGEPAEAVLFSGQDEFGQLLSTAARYRSPPWRSCSCSRASRGASRSATSAAGPRSRRCSSAPPAVSSPRTCRGRPRHPWWPCAWRPRPWRC